MLDAITRSVRALWVRCVAPFDATGIILEWKFVVHAVRRIRVRRWSLLIFHEPRIREVVCLQTRNRISKESGE